MVSVACWGGVNVSKERGNASFCALRKNADFHKLGRNISFHLKHIHLRNYIIEMTPRREMLR